MRALVLLGLLGATAVHANDWHMEIGAGQAAYRTYGDGIWYQLGMPHYLDAQGKLYLLGITNSISDRWDWHVDYVNFGKASASCWCTSDDNYNYRSHAIIDPNYPVKPIRFNGAGNVQGIQFKTDYWMKAGSVEIAPVAGVMVYRNTWRETVYNWTSTEWHIPITDAKEASRKLRLGGVIGLAVKEGRFTVRAEEVLMKPEPMTGVPPLWRNVVTAYLTYEL